MPALAAVAFVVWALAHTRYQGSRREGFMRLRGRVWPPPIPALACLIVAALALYGSSDRVMEARVLPIALTVLAGAALLRTVPWAGVRRGRPLAPVAAPGAAGVTAGNR